MISQLPNELTLHILSYLPLPTLHIIPVLSKEWNVFFQVNSEAIHRAAAASAGLVGARESSMQALAEKFPPRMLAGVAGFEDFFRRQQSLSRRWFGKGPSRIKPYEAPGPFVHRIKVAEQEGVVITTSCEGGVDVTDMEDGELLWALPPECVRPYAHCEYSNGYLVFDRFDSSKEVWCLQHIHHESPVHPRSLPDSYMLNAVTRAEISRSRPQSERERGVFKPHALLRSPVTTRAYRLAGYHLLVASWDVCIVWDVRTGAMIQSLRNYQNPGDSKIANLSGDEPNTHQAFKGSHLHALGPLTYVDLNESHIFLCAKYSCHAFDRRTGSEVCTFYPSVQPMGWVARLRDHGECSVEKLPGVLVEHPVAVRPWGRNEGCYAPRSSVIAAHISPSGKSFAILSEDCALTIVDDFPTVSRDPTLYALHSIRLQLGPPSSTATYLAYDVSGKSGDEVIVVSSDAAVYIVHHSFSGVSPTSDLTPFVTVHRVTALSEFRALSNVSCLQVGTMGIWLNWMGADWSDTGGLVSPDDTHHLEDEPMVDHGDISHWPSEWWLGESDSTFPEEVIPDVAHIGEAADEEISVRDGRWEITGRVVSKMERAYWQFLRGERRFPYVAGQSGNTDSCLVCVSFLGGWEGPRDDLAHSEPYML